METKTETEIKLRIDEDEMARLKASPWWRALAEETAKDLHSDYFDTPDQTLRKLGVSLRTRNKGDAICQTIKLANGGALQRREWEAVIPDPVPDPSLVIDPALPEAVRTLTAADLKAAFAVDVRRETRRLAMPKATLELALDDGAVVKGALRRPLRELEIELVEGAPDAVIDEARRVVDLAGGRIHFTTKADRGYDLAAEDGAPWCKAPPLRLAPGLDAGAALREILRHALEHLTRNDDCARRNAHIEGVHQCRVALRKMRAALKLYEGVLPPAVFDPVAKEAKAIAGVFGAARDLDVLQTEILAPALEALDAPGDVAPLIEALEAERSAAYADVAALIGSARYGRFLIDVLEIAAGDAWREDLSKKKSARLAEDARAFAGPALEKTRKRLLARGRGFRKMSAKERHALRIDVKKMRYAADAFAPLYGRKKAGRFLEGLAGLQDGLGAMNDVVVAKGLLADLIDARTARNEGDAGADGEKERLSYAAGCVLGWRRRQAADLNEALLDEWRRFKKTDPFWR